MNTGSQTQLMLGVRLSDDATFNNFLVASENRQLLTTIQGSVADELLLYLWGGGGSGRSHLLQALCHNQSETGAPALYLPLGQRAEFAPEILQQSTSLALLCLDDVDEISTDMAWQEAVFHCINERMESGMPLVVSANCAPRDLSLSLPDLRSRLQRGLTFQLHAADDSFKKQILQFRARLRGIDLSEQVCDFILLRADRSMSALMAVLEKLDDASMQHKRRITVPLVKEILDW